MEMNELIQNGLENSKRVIDRTLESLTPAELKWQPRPDANSIGLILFHCIRSEEPGNSQAAGQTTALGIAEVVPEV